MFKPSATHVVRTRLTATMAVVFALSLVTGSALAQTGTLEGIVTDADSGDPIAGAMLVAWGSEGGDGMPGQGGGGGARYAFTDGSGGYVFEEMPVGDYFVCCGKPGYFMQDAEATVVEDGVTVLDFALNSKVFGSVSGFVTDAITGEPIAGARVGLRPVGGAAERGPGGPGGGGGFWLHAMTGSDGSYLIERIPAGEYQAGATSHGYYPSEPTTVTVVDGEPAEIDFALEPLAFGRVEGMVADAVTGEPLAGTHVALWRSVMDAGDGAGSSPGGGGLWLHAVTGDDGRYAIENVPADDYEGRVWAFGYFPPEPVQLTVLEGETTEVNFILDPLVFGNIEGTVTDGTTGLPIANALVFASPQWVTAEAGRDGEESEKGRWNMAVTDENGFYRLEDVPAGAWTVRAFAWGYRTGATDVDVVDGETAQADVVLEPYAAKADAYR